MTESAQLFKGVHDTPVYTDILFNKPLRLWVAVSLYGGAALTVVLTILCLDSGHARSVLIGGLAATAAAGGAAALMPRGRPTLRFRVASWWQALRPTLATSTNDPLLAPPTSIIGNLSFTAHGVYAHYLISGLPYYLQSTKRRIGVADRHQSLSREIPAGTWAYGLSVPQNQRQLLRAMLHGHRHKPQWVAACRQMASVIAEQKPRTRVYWLAMPVDAGRAGHSPVGQVAKMRDWVIGRDKDSDDSVAAYQRLAHDIITALPEEFAPVAASEDMIDWFWRHNAWRGVFTNPLPRRRTTFGRLDGSQLPAAVFDDGDQHHHAGRALPLRLCAAALAAAAVIAAAAGIPIIAVAAAALGAAAGLAWLLGIRRIPSWSKALRVSNPDNLCPDSYQAILPVVDMPTAGIIFPGSEFLQALDDLDTGATFDFAVNLVTLSREMEFVRNDRAKGNIDDQFTQRRDVRNGDAELITTSRQLAEYNRQLSANIDERPLQAAFLIAVGAPDHHTLDYSVKRLREELTQSGQIAIRHYRGAQTRLWAAFNPGTPNHKTAVDQFAQPTTTKKWSRFVPFTSSMVGNTTGILLGFNRNNASSSAVLLDLPGTARRNRNPCLVCSGALGYGKSYAAKRITRAEIQRGAQAFIVDPGTEWETALADVANKAVIDMAGNQFSCDPLRTFPANIAGGYWLDYMVPMMSLDPRSTGVRRLRTILEQDARQRLGITSTAALMTYIAGLQAPTGPDTRPAQVVTLAEDLAPILAALQSWATYDFTQAIFDATLPVPDLTSLDGTIWLTGSLDLPTAEDMSTPHLYQRLSDRKRASVAIYGMLVRLARVTFFADKQRFGLIVIEEAAALLNSRAGADDAHLISRRARKHYTGLLIITQDPIRDLALMGDQFITQQLIMPFENDDLARQVAAKVGIRPDDYADIEEFFLAQPSSEEMRDPTAFDDTDDPDPAAAAGRGARQGYGFFVDEFRRKSPIWVASEPDTAIHHAYDTTPGRAA
jgi:AAA-like domain